MGQNLSDHPLAIPDNRLQILINQIKDYQITHGSLIKLLPGVNNNEESPVQSVPVGVAVFPTPWPRELFERATEIQQAFNELYIRISEDPKWLGDVLVDLRRSDSFTQKLWRIWEAVSEEQKGEEGRTNLGIFRSDYMLHDRRGDGQELDIRQVEFNTFSVAGGTHGNIVGNMHRHLCRTGAFDAENTTAGKTNQCKLENLPINDTIKGIVAGLKAAHEAYGPARSSDVSATAMLMVVQPHNINICDERPLEYALWDQSPSIPCYRVVFSDEVLERTSLTADKLLLYHPPHTAQPVEISVVYFRAGYDMHEYTDAGIKARYLLDRSRAIICPSILSHLATFKKVQQALCVPGAVERFLPDEKARLVRATFSAILPMDEESRLGQYARELTQDSVRAIDYILKPSLEGGGHNVYGIDIVPFLAKVHKRRWAQYILMECIRPPKIDNILLTGRGVYQGPVVSELGMFGTCLWMSDVGDGVEILRNECAGWSFKTKAADVDEMSVVKGYGCFDCPYLTV
ncbi:glutathione synthase [Pseudovirgaria hyperparasitica]|uniref:Glutathione synthetase n=1 Tax=Pseudovirgaria hyperparasitica TaxID=470096 RepID=A0A6A6W0Q1_9PEZI|nr:glutathione synthase [Pseudovirgaria hyperparasitica]KAF2755510.1 glutathione synthase [Pseudovirgaria hyperparasitica]